tara:strand:+ start:4664 stop:5497 length:834 start_codon:yes stop_codon:yes gene_type:complete
MATFIDERQDKDDKNETEEISDINETSVDKPLEPIEESTPEPEAKESTEEELPDKYKGKSTAEIVRMHQEAEKLLGRQSSEVGELRKVVDDYIQTQLSTTNAPKTTDERQEEIDFFSDPEKAVDNAISNHPKIKQAEQASVEYQQKTAMSELQKRHPDMKDILSDGKFVDWIKASKIRTQLFAQADQDYDYEAADELFSTWKERQQIVSQTANNEKQQRKDALKAASTGNARGSGEKPSKKIYRRSDIIKLMKDDPERYLALSDEIMQAYQERRVRN